MPEVVAIGAANVDLVAKVHRFPETDDEVAIKSLDTLGGGSGANVAVGVSRLSHSAGFVGLIGTDNFGDFLVKEFEKDGVDFSFTKRINGNSGMVFAAVNEDGQRILYTSEGIASGFSKEHIPLDYIKNAKLLHLTSIDGERVLEAFELAAKVAEEAGVRVIIDPGAIFTEKGLHKLENILRNCFIFRANKVEAKMLTGSDDERAVEKILETGVENVIITHGGKGCFFGNKNGIKFIPFLNKVEIDKIDTTGAGDSFSAGLITALLENKSIEDAVKFAMQIGRISIGVLGARGTPRREEVERLGIL